MGKTPYGLFGPTNGKIGRLVSYTLRGEQVARIVGTTTKKRSPKQFASSQRLIVVNAFLKPIKAFISLGFRFEAEGTSKHQYSLAMSYHMLNATRGEYPNIEMDFSKIVVSRGKLPPVENLSANKTGKCLKIKWRYNPKADFENRNDRTMVLLIFPDKKDPIFFLSGHLRSEGSHSIKLDSSLIALPCYIYVAYSAENQESVSDSRHVYIT